MAKPINIAELTEEEFKAELEKGYADVLEGNVMPVKEAFEGIRRDYGICGVIN